MKDDVAFQSQQFAEQVEHRRDHYADQMQQAWNQLPQGAADFRQAYAQQQQMRMAQQQNQMQMDAGAQALAGEQIRQQRAREELQWARELHTTNMMEHQRAIIAAQRRREEAAADFEVAKSRKATDELNAPPPEFFTNPTAQTMIRASGIDASYENGKPVTKPATPEVQKAAQQELEQIRKSMMPDYQWQQRKTLKQMELEAEGVWRAEDRQSREAVERERTQRMEGSAGYHDFNSQMDGLTSLATALKTELDHGEAAASTPEEKAAWAKRKQMLLQRQRDVSERMYTLNMARAQADQDAQPAGAVLKQRMMDGFKSMSDMVNKPVK